MKAILIALILSNCAYAAPVPTHLFPKRDVEVGELRVWEGNPTVWVVKRIEETDVYIQCADGTGDVYKQSMYDMLKTEKVNP